MSINYRLISGIKFNAVSTILITLMQTSQLIVLARLLSPIDFGLMSMMEIVIGIAYMFTDFGISGAIIHKSEIKPKELSSLYWVNYIASISVFLLLLVLRYPISGFFNEQRLIPLLGLLSVIFCIAPLGQLYQVLYQKQLSFNIIAKVEIISSFLSVLITIGCAISGLNVFSLIFGEIGRTLVKAVLYFINGRKNWVPQFHLDLSEILFFLKFGLYQMGEKVTNYLNQRIDQILIGALIGANTLGLYTMAYNIAIAPFLRVNPVVTRVAFPTLSLIQNDREKIKNTYYSLVRALSHINFPILGFMIVLAQPIVELFLGSQWSGAIIFLQLLCIVAIIRSIINPVGSLLLAKGRADLGFYWNLFATIIQTPILYLAINKTGAMGAAISLIAIYTIHLFLGYFVLIKPLIGNSLCKYALSILPSLISTAASCLVILVVKNITTHQNMFSFGLMVTFGSLTYIFITYTFYGKTKSSQFLKTILRKNAN